MNKELPRCPYCQKPQESFILESHVRVCRNKSNPDTMKSLISSRRYQGSDDPVIRTEDEEEPEVPFDPKRPRKVSFMRGDSSPPPFKRDQPKPSNSTQASGSKPPNSSNSRDYKTTDASLGSFNHQKHSEISYSKGPSSSFSRNEEGKNNDKVHEFNPKNSLNELDGDPRFKGLAHMPEPPPKVDPKYTRENFRDQKPIKRPENPHQPTKIIKTYSCPSCFEIFPRQEIKCHSLCCSGRICRFCQEYYPESLIGMHKEDCPHRSNPSCVSGMHSALAQSKHPSGLPIDPMINSRLSRPVIHLQDPFAQMLSLHLMGVPMPNPPQGIFMLLFDKKPNSDKMEAFFDSIFSHRAFMQMNRKAFSHSEDLKQIIQILMESEPKGSRKGASLEGLNRINEGKFIQRILEEGQPDQCTICLSNFEENENLGTLGCQHCYHLPCIKIWAVQYPYCPLCMKEIK